MESEVEPERSGSGSGLPPAPWMRVLTKGQYIGQRLAEIGDVLKTMVSERDAQARRLGRDNISGPVAKDAWERRAYAVVRIRLLKAERTRLLAEQATAGAGELFHPPTPEAMIN